MDQQLDKAIEEVIKDKQDEDGDALAIPKGPMTRAMTRRLHEAVGNILKISWKQEDCLGRSLSNQDTLTTLQAEPSS